jgi:hypothetical protein
MRIAEAQFDGNSSAMRLMGCSAMGPSTSPGRRTGCAVVTIERLGRPTHGSCDHVIYITMRPEVRRPRSSRIGCTDCVITGLGCWTTMKIGTLQSIAHNIAASLGSGIGLLIGVYTLNIFQEAGRSRNGYLLVDFLNGRTWGGVPSRSLARAIKLYRDALPQLCTRHGASREDFRRTHGALFNHSSRKPYCGHHPGFARS